MHTAREHRLFWALIAALVVLAASVGIASAARAATTATVTVSPTTADPDYATTLTLSGTGFQPLKGGWGGIYVFFGTVSGTWQPSKGGVSGVDYLYVPDKESKDNNGYEKFVSYEDGGTLSAANGGIIAADGSWSTSLVVPGATFQAEGREGTPETVDCRKVQCGVITIGAHGVVDDRNETFTPVDFAVPGAASNAGAAPSDATTAQTAPATQAAAPGTPTTPTPTVAPEAAATRFSLSSIGTTWWILGGAVLVALIAVIAGLVSVGRARGTRGKGRTS